VLLGCRRGRFCSGAVAVAGVAAAAGTVALALTGDHVSEPGVQALTDSIMLPYVPGKRKLSAALKTYEVQVASIPGGVLRHAPACRCACGPAPRALQACLKYLHALTEPGSLP